MISYRPNLFLVDGRKEHLDAMPRILFFVDKRHWKESLQREAADALGVALFVHSSFNEQFAFRHLYLSDMVVISSTLKSENNYELDEIVGVIGLSMTNKPIILNNCERTEYPKGLGADRIVNLTSNEKDPFAELAISLEQARKRNFVSDNRVANQGANLVSLK